MLLVGGIFIFFSAFIYLILMILIMFFFATIRDQIPIIVVGGVIALIFGLLNIKDFFFFKKGPSLSISESKKPKLYSQMRKVIRITSIPALIIATVVLAISANMVELVCSLNLPVIYTGILTSYNLSGIQNILYLIAYNLIYVIPLLVLVITVVISLGRWKLSEIQGRKLKLFSGLMMFMLGIIMLAKPELLNDVFTAVIILIISVLVTFVLSKIWKNKDFDAENPKTD
jgi:cytochrome c biogenesis protein CcdA